MSGLHRAWKVTAAGLLLAAGLGACAVTGVGYDGGLYVGGVYEAPGFVYGGWGPGYRVGPPRGGGFARGGGGRAAPSIPSRARGR